MRYSVNFITQRPAKSAYWPNWSRTNHFMLEIL